MSKVSSRRLGDLLTLKRGYDLPEKVRVVGPYPVISSAGVSGYHNEFKVEGPGVVTGRYGTLGEVYYVEGKYWPHNTALYVQDFKDNDPKYIYYLLSCLGRIRTSDKSAVPGVNRNELHEMEIPAISDIFVQIKARKILEIIDKKIGLNNHINAELEAMAKTLYDYWFVQFDFPDANGKSYKTSGGKMVYNATLKREIPVGWSASNILSLADLLGGGTPTKTKPEYWNGSIPFFTPTDSDKNVYSLYTQDTITDFGLKNSSTRLFEKNTIFITARGSVGRLALNSVPMAMNQSCYALRAKKDISFAFLYYLVKELIHHLEVKATGSVFNSIVSNDIKYTNLALPDNIYLIDEYARKIEPVFEKIELLTKENQQLATLRDWLLPLLMNGQVTVK
ncbi:restriction endonuclease subunit S [Pectobacterium polaris]|uniref:Restriction endonuclease subunit S n=1 Tax=Pectobacterium polaris TaxID=2042057 RepID=A0AAW5GE25_9GAMM|nr:restriction endonuclease subunit S [Pectobacterium polaris]MCL6351564.1 restriction endonuclease subunit S [Pectobacterium polaris]MCL6368962.1 restriction endonuclease subunit S [Pectobacterium polaris]